MASKEDDLYYKATRSSELRDRLRTRLLNKRRDKRLEKQRVLNNNTTSDNNATTKLKVEPRVPVPSNMPPPAIVPRDPIESTATSTATKEIADDIRGLVDYIEGHSGGTKADIAVKKAAKKARQKEKKEQERLEAELEAQRKEEEEKREIKRREVERLKELERQEKLKKQQEKSLKKKLKKQRRLERELGEVEETIPAMVTIKRVPNSDTGAPSVTITLKGYTPDQDKLLYTLVDKPEEKENTPITQNDTKPIVPESNKSKKKRKKEKGLINASPPPPPPKILEEPKIFAKEVKVTLAVDNNSKLVCDHPHLANKAKLLNKTTHNCCNHEQISREEEFRTFGNLRLPPGITITKVQNPVPKTYLGSEQSIKSQQGVIVVDPDKLLKKNGPSENGVPPGKKKKRRKNKKPESSENISNSAAAKMVTLKNPLFQQYTQSLNKPDPMASEPIRAASIITNENGMVTIRSSRLQQSLEQGIPGRPMGFPMAMPVPKIDSKPISTSPTDEKLVSPAKAEVVTALSLPNTLVFENNAASCESGPISDIIRGISCTSLNDSPSPKSSSPEPVIMKSTNGEDTVQDTLDAQQILSGLPGIEITKVDRNAKWGEERVQEEAQVTIIPSSGSEFGFDFGKDDDDWIYESVFKPRDVLEDELDDEELELEKFKRFCEQSIPPKCKEKVALNVADIVLKKKTTDVKFS